MISILERLFWTEPNIDESEFHRSVRVPPPRERGKREKDQRKGEEMAAVVRGVFKAIKEKGIGGFFRDFRDEGYLNCIFDGNLLQTKIHSIGATLVGVDKFGNKYYEKLGDTQYGRHRFVEYAQKSRYNASQVPPEWHGWLHYITDHTGDELLMLKPKRYGVEHKENLSGEGEEFIYHSKGHALNTEQRDWTRYQAWQPKKN
ncbi:NADH dehydrogenase [ubiquinone] 1 alpha subcomplex subunit 12 [Rhynchospora pubera]|uniref:NADH dehydrogenase [ubiquinone] 1 alpha subcomplex subunit 12 n=2 Tax=Rhynchospora pubera TaxID=906938 RepID=A0AAV8E4X4_9POAL|nr:NADH dehydrogenase [ubiquinone] 1 alpha subcomplex subunit 12 [Rhynchospora pubera]